jgi:heme/copper-type cytochrome/quinol oxidase subunit 2
MTRSRLIVRLITSHRNIPVTKPVREAKARLWAVAPLMMMIIIIIVVISRVVVVVVVYYIYNNNSRWV